LKTFLTYDSGLYSSLAEGLSKHGDKSLYYTPWGASFFPLYSDYAIGKGFNMEKVLYFFDHIDKSDCICNFDVHGNDAIDFLRKHFPNKPIFGSGKVEKLENSRWGLKKIIKALGLPVQKSIKIKGVHKLCEYLLENKNQYVKVDIFRGSINSFYAKDYKSVELLTEYIEHELGIFSEDFEFVVEEAIKTDKEWGVDTFFDGNDFVKPYIYGIELGKDSYVGKVSETLPEPLNETMEKLKPVLKDLDWRGCISTEEKILSKKEHYFLDICARAPNPLGLLYPQIIDNWPEMVYDIASKKPTRLQTKSKYVGCVPIYSKHTKQSWVKVNFPDKFKDNVKFMTGCKVKNDYVAVKGSPEEVVCVAVAGESSLSGLINKLKEVVGEIDCYGVDKNALGQLDLIKETTNASKSIVGDF
jgi:hypothetical protein